MKAIKTYPGEDGDFAKKQKVMHSSFLNAPAISLAMVGRCGDDRNDFVFGRFPVPGRKNGTIDVLPEISSPGV